MYDALVMLGTFYGGNTNEQTMYRISRIGSMSYRSQENLYARLLSYRIQSHVSDKQHVGIQVTFFAIHVLHLITLTISFSRGRRGRWAPGR